MNKDAQIKIFWCFNCQVPIIKSKKINGVMILLAFIHAAAILQALVVYGTNSKYAFPYEFFMLVVVMSFMKEKFNWFSKPQDISEPA